jgi:hypothetical protein
MRSTIGKSGNRRLALPYLKRFQDASIPKNAHNGDDDFQFPSLRAHDTTEALLPKTSPLWLEVVKDFTEKFEEIYIKSNMKKRAHLDKFDDNGLVTVIYGKNAYCIILKFSYQIKLLTSLHFFIHIQLEPKEKWANILLLDAIVHFASSENFSQVIISSLERRNFNQHVELRKSICRIYGEPQEPETNNTVSPEIWDRDLLSLETQCC